MILSIGTGIKTGPDSHALITFFEGSTSKLEPDTYLEIRQLENGGEQSTTIILKQWLGRTWNRVIKMADSGSRYEIETPSATAIVRGTLFTTDVKASGATTISTTEGLVSVTAQGKEVFVSQDQQTEVEKGVNPSQPAAIPAPVSQIIITADRPAFGSIIDPTGSSTGIFPTGEQFNQIRGSYSAIPSDGTQIITVAEPMTGEYIIALRSSDEGVRHFRIQGESEGKIVFSYTGTWNAKKESGQLIHLNLQIDNGLIVDNDISLVEPIGDKKPEKVVDRKSGGNRKPFGETETEESEEEEIPDRKDRSDRVNDKDDVDTPDKNRPDVQKARDDRGISGEDRLDQEKDEDDRDRSDRVNDRDDVDTPDKNRPDVQKDRDDRDIFGEDRSDVKKDEDDRSRPDVKKDQDDRSRPDVKKDEDDRSRPAERTIIWF